MSSSTPTPDFADLVERSLAALRREHPEAYGRFGRTLAGTTVALRVDGEAMTLAFDGEASLHRGASAAPVEFTATCAALLDLVQGRLSLRDAVRSGRADLRGAVPALARFDEALMLYLHGAVRSPTFPALVRELAALANSHAGARARGPMGET